MTIRRTMLFIACAMLLLVSGRTAYAQFPKNITLSFFTPENIDPNKVVTFLNTNTQTVDGADLIPPPIEGAKGIEIHSAIPGPHPGGILDITQLTVQFNYTDGLIINSQGTSGYNAWQSSTTLSGGVYTVVFILPPSPLNGAPINNNFVPGGGDPFPQSYASLSVSGSSDALSAFALQNANGGVRLTPGEPGTERGGMAVPEPGALALLSGLVMTAGIFSMARLRRNA